MSRSLLNALAELDDEPLPSGAIKAGRYMRRILSAETHDHGWTLTLDGCLHETGTAMAPNLLQGWTYCQVCLRDPRVAN